MVRMTAAMIGLIPALALAGTDTLTHQGRLVDVLGQPLDGSVIATFNLYTSADSEPFIWTEEHTVTLSDGYYGVELGTQSPLPVSEFQGDAAPWLGIDIAGVECQRVQLTSVPSALTAGSATTLDRTDCATNEVLSYDGSEWVCTAVPTLTGTRNSHFTRWGRVDCPSGTSSIYAGWMASGYYNHGGGPSSYLCMHPVAEYDARAGTGNDNRSILYQVEFEMNSDPHTYLRPLHDYEARCAVCQVPADMVLMVPGTRSCPSGWSKAYDGFIMGNWHTHVNSNEAICVDQNPLAYGNNGNQNGGLLYTVEFDQGSGAVPYTNQREVTCAVCTR